MDYLRNKAEGQHVSLSKCVSDLLKKQASSAWPEGFFDLYGAVQDDTFAEPEDLSFSDDAPRLEL